MPRAARIKTPEGIYHIMIRSISEINLFNDSEDKEAYLSFIKKYQDIYRFKVYAYCLMTNHGHIEIDSCGADISTIMKSINQCYAAYFNRKYQRHGHVFQDRFKSKLVTNNKYLITLSAYIHNNPKDIEEFKNNVENYKYSSLRIYLGLAIDTFKILNTDFILQFFNNEKSAAKKLYLAFITGISNNVDDSDLEFSNEGSECRSERNILIRNFKTDDIINFISKYTNSSFNMHIKFNHANAEYKSLCIVLMRSLCNLTYKDICKIIGNITASGLYQLCEKGYRLITQNDKYTNLIDDFIREFAVV